MTSHRFFMTSALLLVATIVGTAATGRDGWSERQMDELRSLSLTDLEPLAPDPTNRVADDVRAAALGQRLFFDTRLSANGLVACATCHQTERDFQDGIPLGHGVGTTARRTMPIAATARSPFLFWDGRKDSLWAQALGPLESPVEHGGARAQYARLITTQYRTEYEAVFGPLPDLNENDAATLVFVNIGKAIAAFERRVAFSPSRFDRYVDALTERGPVDGILTKDEVAGLKLFIGKAHCTQCHNGPLLTNNEFHNTGVPPRAGLALDDGRLTGAAAVLRDEFNCRSRWSDAPERCSELEFLITGDRALQRAYKVPSLRNVAGRAPYMDAGQFPTLSDVLNHYNRAPAAPAGQTELKPLGLKAVELSQLEAFLRALSSPLVVNGLPRSVSTQ